MLITPSPLTQSRVIVTTPSLPEQIELHRDRMWRRDEDLRVESAIDAERFIEDVGFANTLTDARRAGPSLYIEVCGSDVSLPRSNQNEADGGNQRSEVSSCAGKPAARRSSKQMSGVRRSGSFRPPFIFIDAADEEPQDHDYHIQQGPERGHREHARAERGIEISQPA